MMLEDLAVPQPPGTAPPLSDIEKEQTIYDTILHEIIRQVTVECADRGILLEKVSRRYSFVHFYFHYLISHLFILFYLDIEDCLLECR